MLHHRRKHRAKKVFDKGTNGNVNTRTSIIGEYGADKSFKKTPPSGQSIEGVTDMVESAKTTIGGWIDGLIAKVKSILGIASPSTVMMGIATDMVQGLIDGITNMVAASIAKVKEWIDGLIAKVKEILGIGEGEGEGGTSKTLITIATALVQGLIDGITNMVESAVTAVGDWINALIAKAKELLGISAEQGAASTSFLSIGKAMVQGLWNGAKELWGKFTEWLDGVIGGLPQWVKDILHIESPSKPFVEIGRQTIAGLRVGIESGAAGVLSALSDTVASMLSALSALGGSDFASQAVAGFDYVRTAVDTLQRALAALAETLASIAIPNWIAEISAAVRQLTNAELPQLTAGLDVDSTALAQVESMSVNMQPIADTGYQYRRAAAQAPGREITVGPITVNNGMDVAVLKTLILQTVRDAI